MVDRVGLVWLGLNQNRPFNLGPARQGPGVGEKQSVCDQPKEPVSTQAASGALAPPDHSTLSSVIGNSLTRLPVAW